MKIKEWWFDYCQDYHPDGPCSNLDCDAKPTLKLFLYNAYRKFRAWTPIFKIRMFFQKLFTGFSGEEIWEAQRTMARRILPVLYAFKKYERHGFPGIFSEYEENAWGTKEEYDKAIIEGRMIGGGEKRWEAELNHIIKAVEFVAWEGNNKKITKWYVENFGFDPWADDERNYYKYYTYKCKNGNTGMTFKNRPEEDEDHQDIAEHESYGNSELTQYVDEYVSAGLEKLGLYWRTFWD